MVNDVPVPCFDVLETVETQETTAGSCSFPMRLVLATQAGRDACAATRCLMQAFGMMLPAIAPAAVRLPISVYELNRLTMESMMPKTMPLAGLDCMQVFIEHSLAQR